MLKKHRNIIVLLGVIFSFFVYPLSTWGMYASFDEAFDSMSSDLNLSSTSTPKLSREIDTLQGIIQLHHFDPHLLSEIHDSEEILPLNLENYDKNFALSVLLFYSENPEERETAFERTIKIPLLKSLKAAAEYTYQFPQTLKYLIEPSVFMSPLIDVAIRDIFTHHPQTLDSLLDIFNTLSRDQELTDEQKTSLLPFRKLAGYFYDKKALAYIVQENTRFFASHPSGQLNFDDPITRLAILRLLQLKGEFLKSLLPSTLNQEKRLPQEDLLETLRDQHLSHINRRKLDAALSKTRETAVTFEKLYDDLKILHEIFDSMKMSFPEIDNDRNTNLRLWNHLNGLSEERSKNQGTGVWKGLRRLKTLFTYTRSSNSIPSARTFSQSFYQQEISELLPYPYEEDEIHRIHRLEQNLKVVFDVLNGEIKDSTVFLDKLKKETNLETITKKFCEDFLHKKEELKGKKQNLFSKKAKIDESIKKTREDFVKKLSISDKAKSKKLETLLTKLSSTKDAALIEAKQIAPSIDEQEFGKIFETLLKWKQEIDTILKESKTQTEEMNQKLNSLYEETRLSILRITREESDEVRIKSEIIDSINKKRAELKQKLEELQKKATHGQKNFTSSYQEFLDGLPSELSSTSSAYDWTREVSTPLERLFHKVNHTSISRRSDKHKHRHKKLQDLLALLHQIRSMASIKTDLYLETDKEAFHQFLEGKGSIITDFLQKKKGSVDNNIENVHHDLIKSWETAFNQIQTEIQTLTKFLKGNVLILEDDESTTENKLTKKRYKDLCQKISALVKDFHENVDDKKRRLHLSDQFFKKLLDDLNRLYKTFNTIVTNIEDNPEPQQINVTTLNIQIHGVLSPIQHTVGLLYNILRKEREDKVHEQFREAFSQQNKFFEQRKKISTIDSEKELAALREETEKIIHEFLTTLEEVSTPEELADLKRELFDLSRVERKRQILHFIKKEHIKSHPHDEPNNISDRIAREISENDLKYLAYEFIVAAFYELFKDINDYPELHMLRNTDSIRNYFFHMDPFQSDLLISESQDSSIIMDAPLEELAKQVSILSTNVKFLLEDCMEDILKLDSLPNTSLTSHPTSHVQLKRSGGNKTSPPTRKFNPTIGGQELQLYEHPVRGDGNCGYTALGTIRDEAAMLLLNYASRAEIRSLVAPEIYDLFMELPDEMKEQDDYSNLIAHQAFLDEEYRKIVSLMNDLIGRIESDKSKGINGNRLNADELREYYANPSHNLSNEQRRARIQLLQLDDQMSQLNDERLAYCEREDTFKTFVTSYIQPSPSTYLNLYGESNWLNYSSILMADGQYRTSIADAIAHLLGRNLVIVGEGSNIRHQYTTPGATETLYLLHIGNWHFNKLLSHPPQ